MSLGEVTLGAGDLRQEIKLSVSAMMRIEERAGVGIDKALEGLQTEAEGFSVSRFVENFAELMDGGRGAGREEAADLMDQAGFAATLAAFERACEVAFPEASGQSSGKAPAARPVKKAR